VLPQTEDSEVIRALIGRRRDAGCHVAEGFVNAYKIEPPIGIDIHGAITLVIQLEVERQTDKRIAIVDVIPRVGRARHDRIGSRGYDVLTLRRTLYWVIFSVGHCWIEVL